MEPSDYAVNANRKINWKVLQVVWPYMQRYRNRIVISMVCLVLSKGASVAGPFILKHIVDDLNGAGVSSLALVPIALVAAYGLARFLMIILGEIRDTVFGRVTERAMRHIGLQVFKHVHELDLDFHLNRRTGG
ncbi:MAG: ABC-type multidrug transport system fused ATPase/permease subunit, partial [Porticoccaceae bacterium]